MLMMTCYILDYSMLILHHLTDEADYTILTTYDPPNVPPYPYPYVPYRHPYTHYPDIGNEVGGSLRGVHKEDEENDKSDAMVCSDDYERCDAGMDDD
ncbi:hypothetical protein Tco_0156112 [Tanacetum coccineum]